MASEYTIAGGLIDAQRLARQAHVMAQATEAFLSRLGLSPGWACLDVGCRDGQVTIEMARVAGPDGHVVGVDLDAELLELARQAALRAEVNAEFVRGDARRPTDRQGFDLAYARLLLSHLVDPSAALRAMQAAVKDGGVVAVEDLFTGTLRSDPPAPALDRLQEVYCATVRSHGGDPTIGPRLGALLSASGLEDVREETVVNRMDTVDDKLFLAHLVHNMRTSILEAGAATGEQVAELEAAVEEAAREPSSTKHASTRCRAGAQADTALPASFFAAPGSPGTQQATPENIRAGVRRARRRADVVIATFHWGVERATVENARQRGFAAEALRAGATAVIGAHPHVLQPIRSGGPRGSWPTASATSSSAPAPRGRQAPASFS